MPKINKINYNCRIYTLQMEENHGKDVQPKSNREEMAENMG